MSLDLRHMRHVLALSEHGSLSRAAVALRLSQPALSRSLQSIERRIGAPLFARTPTGVVPTDVGRVFAERARQVLQLAADLDQEVLSDRTLRAGRVAIGAGPLTAEPIVASAVARFLETHPRVSVRMVTRDWDDLLRQLRAREIDFFVAETSTLQREHDLAVEPLGEHPVHFAARRDHPLAARAKVAIADVFAYPIAAPSRIPPRVLEPLRRAQREAVARSHAARALPALECNALDAVKRVVLGSNAITAATLPCLRDELEDGRIVLLCTAPWLAVRYGLVSLLGRPLDYAAERLRDLVGEAARETAREEKRLAERFGTGGRRATRAGRTRATVTQPARSSRARHKRE